MWAIRVLSGPQAGQVFELKSGKNILGKSSKADVSVEHGGVSRQHAEITVYDNKIIITDLNSRNGTFVNGVRVQNSIVNVGDKIGLYDMLIDIFPMPNSQSLPNMPVPAQPQVSGQNALDLYHAQAPAPMGQPMQPPMGTPMGMDQPMDQNVGASGVMEAPKDEKLPLGQKIQRYIDDVALPGVYKLPEVADYKVVIGGMLFIAVFAVTALSVLPMIQITRSSIERESKRRALSLARSLANQNQMALSQGMETSLSTNQIRMEEGVTNALIIRHSNGTIVAPPKLAGENPDLPFVAGALNEAREVVSMTGVSEIGAAVPISFYDSEIGKFRIAYHAIVIYDMGNLAIDQGKTTSLFIQTFVIALFVGAIVFFFLIKLIEYPFVLLSRAMDDAIRQGQESVSVEFQLPVFQKLVSSVNTLLSRALYGDGQESVMAVNKESEAENLIQLIGFPALALNKEGYIIGANIQFENFINKSTAEMQNQTIQSLPDQALQLSIGDLMDRSMKQPDLISSNELDFSGDTYLISCQAIVSSEGEIEYTLVTISPLVQEDYE